MFPLNRAARSAALVFGAVAAMTSFVIVRAAVRDKAAAPGRLSETGLYASSGEIDPSNLPFVPQYPLWTDGAEKKRWVYLPENATIDASDVDAWRFPDGAKFWKQFSWNGRKVETRMIWKAGADNWVFATYIWTEDQKDAVLAPETGVANVVEVGRGKRHSIPSVEDCSACHRSGPSVVLGFTALQLSDDRDPLAPHAEPPMPSAVTARDLVEKNRLHPPRPELVARPPRIREENPVARAALGYLSANCGGCHNDRGPLARLGLVLLHDTARDGAHDEHAPEPARATTVNAEGRYVMPGIPAESSRTVAPGAPERSALLHRMRSRRPSSQMPPLGTAIPDDEATDLVRRWIESLAPASVPSDRPPR
jgi:mono/diheme cytochrome c family protein